MARGQAYIQVQADSFPSISLFAAGSDSGSSGIGGQTAEGSISMGATIIWNIPGGITGVEGWVKPQGRTLVSFPMDETMPPEQISAVLAENWKGARFAHIQMLDPWCIEMG